MVFAYLNLLHPFHPSPSSQHRAASSGGYSPLGTSFLALYTSHKKKHVQFSRRSPKLSKYLLPSLLKTHISGSLCAYSGDSSHKSNKFTVSQQPQVLSLKSLANPEVPDFRVEITVEEDVAMHDAGLTLRAKSHPTSSCRKHSPGRCLMQPQLNCTPSSAHHLQAAVSSSNQLNLMFFQINDTFDFLPNKVWLRLLSAMKS